MDAGDVSNVHVQILTPGLGARASIATVSSSVITPFMSVVPVKRNEIVSYGKFKNEMI